MKKAVISLLALLLLSGCSPAAGTILKTETEAEQTNSSLTALPEYSILFDQIDLSAYEAETAADSEGNRMISFSDKNGTEHYKSIYIKNEKRLKIKDLSADKLIYNEVIAP